MGGSLGSLIAAFPTPVTGSFESIATFSPSSGTTVTFSSIPSTYKSLQIRIHSISPDLTNFVVRLNGDTAANYAQHGLRGDGFVADATGLGSRTSIQTLGISSGNTSFPAVSIIDIIDYASTSKTKTLRALAGFDTNGSGRIWLGSGLWNSTSAVNSFTVIFASISAGTTIALYGVK